MSWLSPFAWLGAGLVVLPVLVHLLSRRRPRVEAVPTLRFLEATPPLSVKRGRLRDPGLLALRVLAILAAVAALARPSLESSAPLEPEGAQQTRVVLIDSFRENSPDAGALLGEARESARDWVDGGEILEVEARGGRALWHAVEALVAHLDALPGGHELLVLSEFPWGSLPDPGERPLPPGSTRVELRRVGGTEPAGGATGSPVPGPASRRMVEIPLITASDPPGPGPDAGPDAGPVHLEIQAEAAPPPLEGGVSASWRRVPGDRGPQGNGSPPAQGGASGIPPEIRRAAAVLGLAAAATGSDPAVTEADIEGVRSRKLALALARDPELQALVQAGRWDRVRDGGLTQAPPSASGMTALATLAVQGRVDQGLPGALDALDPRWHTAGELEVLSQREPAPAGRAGPERERDRLPEPDDGRREARALWLVALLLLGAEWGVRRHKDRGAGHSPSDGGQGT